MSPDTEPRAEFASSLRAWFVAEMRQPVHDDDSASDAPTAADRTVVDIRDDGPAPRSRRRWLLLAEAAAVLGVVGGLWWVGDRPGEPESPASAPAAPTTVVAEPSSEPSSIARRACEEFRADTSALALGASTDEIVDAATDVRARLTAAVERLDSGHPALAESKRLAAEAIDAADRLVGVADRDRATVDSAVRNLDLIVVAWSRELASVADGDACDALPTLREVL